jgi:putative hydrolase of the HAD superfamily
MVISINNRTIVLLDLDDTLYPEVDFVSSAFKELATMISPAIESIHTEMMKWFSKKEDVFQNLLDHYPASHLTKEKLLNTYRHHHPDIKLNDGVKKILDDLQSHNIPMALITDGRSITQRNKIAALNIEQYFSSIFISGETGKEKQEGSAFRSLHEAYPGYRAYVFGDNVNKDFWWPKKFGWHTIGLRDQGKNIHSQEITVNACPPDDYINSFAELNIRYE